MAEIFTVKIITPDRVFYTGEADFLEFTTLEGEMGVYANHVPTTTILASGIVIIHNSGKIIETVVHSGFVEILNDRVTILVEMVEIQEKVME